MTTEVLHFSAFMATSIVFGMRRSEVIAYICASSLVVPAIHLVFSFTQGWKEYLPFWPVPSLWELLS